MEYVERKLRKREICYCCMITFYSFWEVIFRIYRYLTQKTNLFGGAIYSAYKLKELHFNYYLR